ncbi:MAG: hypothetical protein Q4F65_04225 [Propionibacteriaceae bacterium]|nr:hypothetical protein [Propionibacteriaceae bacterium]
MKDRISWTDVGLVFLALATVLVVALALRPTAVPSEAATAEQSPTRTASAPTTSAEPSDDATDATADDDEEPEARAAQPLTRFITAVDATTVWVAESNGCGSGGQVAVSADGASTWTAHDSPDSVLRIRLTNAEGAGFVVGGSADCEPRLWYTYDAGENWTDPQWQNNAWSRHPDDASQVLRPGGEPITPCEDSPVLDLDAFSGGHAAVLCEGGALLITQDWGGSWQAVMNDPNLYALAMTAPAQGIAAGVSDSCDGVAVQPFNVADDADLSCAEGALARGGEVAVTAAESAIWMAAGPDIWQAPSIGADFERAGDWPEELATP